jgi:hypothetical protein
MKLSVGPLGLEPRLFGTKNRRVASYTMGQLKHRYWLYDARANLVTKFKFESDLIKKMFFF